MTPRATVVLMQVCVLFAHGALGVLRPMCAVDRGSRFPGSSMDRPAFLGVITRKIFLFSRIRTG